MSDTKKSTKWYLSLNLCTLVHHVLDVYFGLVEFLLPLDGVAPLMTNPPTDTNTAFHSPLHYIAVTIVPLKQFFKHS